NKNPAIAAGSVYKQPVDQPSLRRRENPSPARPMPRRVSEAGSGTSETLNNTPLMNALPPVHGSGPQPAKRVMLAGSVLELWACCPAIHGVAHAKVEWKQPRTAATRTAVNRDPILLCIASIATSPQVHGICLSQAK